MGVVKLGNNKYKIIIECGYDIFGKRKRHTEVFTGNSKEVKIREAELLKQYYKKGDKVNLTTITFRQLSELFMEKYEKDGNSLISIRNYNQYLKRINEFIGDMKVNKINSFMLDTMYQKIRLGVKGKELAPKTMLHYYNLMSLIFKQAIKWKIIDNNPNEDATRPKREKKERNFYDTDEATKLLNCLKNENIKYRALITLAIDSGARRSEICALRWSDINFEDNSILIDNSLKVINGVVDEKKAKTEYSNRTIYISEATMEILKEYKKWQDNYILSIGNKWQGSDRVFTSKTGSYMHPDTCGKIIDKILKKYNLPKITFHEIRHTTTTILLENGINPKAVSERNGHANPKITLEIYAHTFNKTKKESAMALNNLINKA